MTVLNTNIDLTGEVLNSRFVILLRNFQIHVLLHVVFIIFFIISIKYKFFKKSIFTIDLSIASIDLSIVNLCFANFIFIFYNLTIFI